MTAVQSKGMVEMERAGNDGCGMRGALHALLYQRCARYRSAVRSSGSALVRGCSAGPLIGAREHELLQLFHAHLLS